MGSVAGLTLYSIDVAELWLEGVSATLDSVPFLQEVAESPA